MIEYDIDEFLSYVKNAKKEYYRLFSRPKKIRIMKRDPEEELLLRFLDVKRWENAIKNGTIRVIGNREFELMNIPPYPAEGAGDDRF